MSNVQSYNALIDRFKAFASGHFILKTFSHGQIDTADLEKFTEYPFMHVVPSNVTYAKGTKTFSFQIVLADLPRDKTDKVEFQREVLSDLQRIAEDLVAEITNHRVLFGDLITVQNVTLEPFLEEFHNTLTGWTVSLELLVPYYWDACSIPAEWNDFFESSTGGTGSILTFIDSIVRDENGNVSLVNDEATPAPHYYYGTNEEGVRGWYFLADEVGLTCATIGSCQTIIDIENAIDTLQAENAIMQGNIDSLQIDVTLKANTADISAVGFSNDYNDLDNLPIIPAAQVNSDWNATSGVEEILNKPTIPTATSDLTNDSGFITISDVPAQVNADWNSTTGASEILNKPTIPSIDGLVPYEGATGDVDLGNNDLYLAKQWLYDEPVGGYGSVHLTDSVFHVEDVDGHSMVTFEDGFFTIANGATIRALLNVSGLTANRDFVLPNTSGTIALTSQIPAAQVNSDWNATSGVAQILNKPTLATVAMSGSYTDLTNKPTIPAAQIQSDWTQANNAALDFIKNKPTLTNGTVTSVSALTLGTTGTDLSSTVANGTTTPVITLNVPTSSATNRGALSSTDWTTFNNKQAALVSGTNIKTVNSTTLLGSGDIAVQATLVSGTNIKTINSTSLLGSGNITVGTFTLPSLTSGSVLFSDGTTIAQNNANFFWDNTNSRLGIGTASPTTGLTVSKALTTTGNELLNITYTHSSYSSGQIQLGQYFNNTRINFIHGANNSAIYLGGANFTIETQNVGNFILSNGTERMRMVATTGNILIGTTTDAGYKFYVNGTSFFNGNTQVGFQFTTSTLIANTSARIGAISGVHASSILDVQSTTQGFLPPRMTTTQKNAIASPASGLVVYDTTLGKLCVRGAAAWETITSL